MNKAFESIKRGLEEAIKFVELRFARKRLAKECAKLDPSFERAMADEGLAHDFPCDDIEEAWRGKL